MRHSRIRHSDVLLVAKEGRAGNSNADYRAGRSGQQSTVHLTPKSITKWLKPCGNLGECNTHVGSSLGREDSNQWRVCADWLNRQGVQALISDDPQQCCTDKGILVNYDRDYLPRKAFRSTINHLLQ